MLLLIARYFKLGLCCCQLLLSISPDNLNSSRNSNILLDVSFFYFYLFYSVGFFYTIKKRDEGVQSVSYSVLYKISTSVDINYNSKLPNGTDSEWDGKRESTNICPNPFQVVQLCPLEILFQNYTELFVASERSLC